MVARIEGVGRMTRDGEGLVRSEHLTKVLGSFFYQ